MDSLILIHTAGALGLAIRADGGRLIVTGPKRHRALAREILERKSDVMALLSGAAAEQPCLRWDESARYVFLERLGIADDLGLDPSPGSTAWNIAVREALRAAAVIPQSVHQGRDADLIDDALAAFAPLGGLAFKCLVSPDSDDHGGPIF